ncbi:hypothetical protein BDP81DRAFT_432379 [Colletotrichum phormii]|uniref:Uncharacterized protein n=1 Tax=Colletotrichum phormii TaxID=359342 RepID=A0AAI9ZLK4_9PEZI|nr:uncharacterized protein BDP81DRAFT_432379 [Colletotrichum phormii]KAK1634216.1 hypothetical protein BDP81DRAFT_432379 [Colletotrichum phormii]
MPGTTMSQQPLPKRPDQLRPDPSPSASTHIKSPNDRVSATATRNRSSTAKDGSLSDNPFALIPTASYSALAQLYHLVRPCLSDQSQVTCLFSPVRQSGLAPAVEALLVGGYGRSFAVVVFAVLVNHVRRMLAPALGVGAFGGPISTLKLAIGSPALFLSEEVEVGFFGRLFTPKGAWKLLGDVVGTIVLERVLVRAAEELDTMKGYSKVETKGSTASGSMEKGDQIRLRAAEKRMTSALVVYLVWILGCAEYLHARAAHVVAVGIAYTKLLRGEMLHKQALWEVLLPFTSPRSLSLIENVGESLSVVRFHLELACFIAWGLYPLIRLAIGSTFRMNPRKSRPGLAVLISTWAWGTGYVTRYSNKYYVGLEMSGILLVIWWIAACGVFLGFHFFCLRIT